MAETFVQVMKGESKESEEYTSFEEQCQWAFNVIRKHSSHLINLFQLVRKSALLTTTYLFVHGPDGCCLGWATDAVDRHP